jgi:hypothetical protein
MSVIYKPMYKNALKTLLWSHGCKTPSTPVPCLARRPHMNDASPTPSPWYQHRNGPSDLVHKRDDPKKHMPSSATLSRYCCYQHNVSNSCSGAGIGGGGIIVGSYMGEHRERKSPPRVKNIYMSRHQRCLRNSWYSIQQSLRHRWCSYENSIKVGDAWVVMKIRHDNKRLIIIFTVPFKETPFVRNVSHEHKNS